MKSRDSAIELLKRLEQEGLNYRADISAVAARAVAAFGGAPGLAGDLRKEWEAAAPGSAVRAKILTTILDMIKLSPLEDEEFEEEDYEAIGRMIRSGSKTNGKSP